MGEKQDLRATRQASFLLQKILLLRNNWLFSYKKFSVTSCQEPWGWLLTAELEEDCPPSTSWPQSPTGGLAGSVASTSQASQPRS